MQSDGLGPEGQQSVAPAVTGVWYQIEVQPRRGVRFGVLDSYAAPGAVRFTNPHPGLTAGSTLFRASGPVGNNP
jgi:hypothetical protein